MSIIGTLGDLRQAVAEEVMRANHRGFAEAFPRMVAFAESRIYDGSGPPVPMPPVRVSEMEVSTTLAFTAGVAAVPANFLEARSLFWDSDIRSAPDYEPPVSFRLNRSKNGTGQPSRYTIEGGSVLLSPMITGDLVFLYYARPTALAADDDTNAVLVRYPTLYFQSALIEAYGYTRNEELRQRAIGDYASTVNGIMGSDIRKKHGGTALYPRIRGSWLGR